MDEKLIQRLESAVTRLEALSLRQGASSELGGDATASADPAILAFDDLISQPVGRVISAAQKIGGQVLEISKVIDEAFSAQKELLIKIKQTQVSSLYTLNFHLQLNPIEFHIYTYTHVCVCIYIVSYCFFLSLFISFRFSYSTIDVYI